MTLKNTFHLFDAMDLNVNYISGSAKTSSLKVTSPSLDDTKGSTKFSLGKTGFVVPVDIARRGGALFLISAFKSSSMITNTSILLILKTRVAFNWKKEGPSRTKRIRRSTSGLALKLITECIAATTTANLAEPIMPWKKCKVTSMMM
jgi:hypothetical protein